MGGAMTDEGSTEPLSPQMLLRLSKLDPKVIAAFLEYGDPRCFNPLLAEDRDTTFQNISDVLQLVNEVLKPHHDIEEIVPGLRLIIQAAWITAQYEGWEAGREQHAAPGRRRGVP